LTITAQSPVDLVVTDPFGRSVSKDTNRIDLASYDDIPLEDGDRHVSVVLPVAAKGEYRILVNPRPDAQPTDTYTLIVKRNDAETVLVDHVRIADTPKTPYSVRVMPTLELTSEIIPSDKAIDLSKQSIKVAILSTPAFNATTDLRRDSITFGKTGWESSLRS